MADEYIPRKDLEKWLRTEMASLDTEGDREFVIERLREEIRAADVAPVRHGRWIENESKRETYGTLTREYWNCEKCGIEICSTLPVFDLTAWHYCPNCGAHMMDL